MFFSFPICFHSDIIWKYFRSGKVKPSRPDHSYYLRHFHVIMCSYIFLSKNRISKLFSVNCPTNVIMCLFIFTFVCHSSGAVMVLNCYEMWKSFWMYAVMLLWNIWNHVLKIVNFCLNCVSVGHMVLGFDTKGNFFLLITLFITRHWFLNVLEWL